MVISEIKDAKQFICICNTLGGEWVGVKEKNHCGFNEYDICN
jgi:hypothetical protein